MVLDSLPFDVQCPTHYNFSSYRLFGCLDSTLFYPRVVSVSAEDTVTSDFFEDFTKIGSKNFINDFFSLNICMKYFLFGLWLTMSSVGTEPNSKCFIYKPEKCFIIFFHWILLRSAHFHLNLELLWLIRMTIHSRLCLPYLKEDIKCIIYLRLSQNSPQMVDLLPKS